MRTDGSCSCATGEAMTECDSHGVDLSGGLEDVPVLFRGLACPLFQYSPDNVEGPGCSTDPSEVTLPGCCCISSSCSSETCNCLQRHGRGYDNTGRLLDLHGIKSAYCSPIFECSALCSCSDACSNRVVQRGLQLRLEVISTLNRGCGVRTLEEIARGTFVCEYAGEVINFDEARRRQLSQSCDENNYIIAVREHAGTNSITETFVDPARVGNVGRFLNHSCMPNLIMLPVRVHSVVPRLALFAAQNIGVREELTFDYSGGFSNPHPVELQSCLNNAATLDNKTEGKQRKVCYCGAENCTGFLPLDLSILS